MPCFPHLDAVVTNLDPAPFSVQPYKLEAIIFGEEALGFAQAKAGNNTNTIAGPLSEVLPASYAAAATVNARHTSQHVEPDNRSQSHSDVAGVPPMASGYDNAYGMMSTHAPPVPSMGANTASYNQQVCVG